MSNGIVTVKVNGLQELRAALQGLAPKLRKRALRQALAAGARIIRDEARRRAPRLKASTYSGASALRRGVRAVGTLQKAITVRTSKINTREGNVGVFVNVRPLRNSGANGPGAKNPKDPYYWRWQEFGWKPKSGPRTTVRRIALRVRGQRSAPATAKPGARFLQLSVGKQGEALRQFELSLGPQILKLNQKGATL